MGGLKVGRASIVYYKSPSHSDFYSWRPLSLNCDLHLLVTVGAQALTRLVFYEPWGIAASCVDVAVCHVPVIIQQGCFLNIFCASVKQANASDRRAYCLRCRIDRFAEKWINRSVNELCFFFLFLFYRSSGCLITTCPDGGEPSKAACFLYLGFCTEGFVLIFRETERLQLKTL